MCVFGVSLQSNRENEFYSKLAELHLEKYNFPVEMIICLPNGTVVGLGSSPWNVFPAGSPLPQPGPAPQAFVPLPRNLKQMRFYPETEEQQLWAGAEQTWTKCDSSLSLSFGKPL